jgi:hypothetical protein
MESREQVVKGRIRDFKIAQNVDPGRRWPVATPETAPLEAAPPAPSYDIPDFLVDQRLVLGFGQHDPALASRFRRGYQRLLRVPTRQLLAALDQPSSAKLFVRRHRNRGWDRFLRFRRAVRFLRDRKDEIVRCGLAVGEREQALVDEDFVAYLLNHPLPNGRVGPASTPLTIYIRRQQARTGRPTAEGGPKP